LKTRLRNVLTLAPLALAWGALLLVAQRSAQRPVLHGPALGAVPAGPAALLSIDLRQLRGSAAAGLGSARARRLVGADLAALCGADPLALAEEIVIAVPGAPADGEFGVAAAGLLDAAAVSECAARVVAARGGRPVTLQEGEFLVITDVLSAGSGVVAVRPEGPLLFGGASYVRQMMAAAERRAPSVLSDARHMALRGEVGDRQALVLSALLTADGRDRIRTELNDPRAPAASVLGLGLSASASDPVRLHGLVGCDRAEPCGQLAETLRRLRDSQETEGIFALLRPLSKTTIEARGPTIHAEAVVPLALAEQILAMFLPP
jgi:hypothetical protein